jgi:hypothetical protein
MEIDISVIGTVLLAIVTPGATIASTTTASTTTSAATTLSIVGEHIWIWIWIRIHARINLTVGQKGKHRQRFQCEVYIDVQVVFHLVIVD